MTAFLLPFPSVLLPASRPRMVPQVCQAPIASTVKTRRRNQKRRNRRASVVHSQRPPSQKLTPPPLEQPSDLPDDLTSHGLLTASQERALLHEIRFIRIEEHARKALVKTDQDRKSLSDADIATALSLTEADVRTKRRLALSARNRLVSANVRLVSMVAGRVFRTAVGARTPHVSEASGISRADLVQEGCVALIRAAELYDGRADARFSTYAARAVWSACQRVATPTSCIVTLPERLRRAVHKMRAAEYTEDDGEGVQKLTNDSQEYLPDHLVQLASQHLTSGVSLDEPMRKTEVGHGDCARSATTTRGALLACARPLPEDVVLEESVRHDVHAACYDVLPRREADILVLRFGLSGKQPMPAKEIATRYGVTGARISQLVTAASDTLREKARYLEQLLQHL